MGEWSGHGVLGRHRNRVLLRTVGAHRLEAWSVKGADMELGWLTESGLKWQRPKLQ
jgi:hypothetical protein